MLTRPQAIRGAQNFVLICLSIGILALYSSYRRPLWLDEFFQFAWGAYPASIETLGMIWRSTHNFNLGQTGVYMFADTLLLNLFGASSTALRLPSLLAAGYLLGCVVVFFRSKSFGFIWQLIALLTFGSQAFILYYAGEARPYLPMAAACVGLAVYYTTPLEKRSKTLIRFIGWSAAIFGCLLHPYVIMYLFSLAFCYSMIYALSDRSKKRRNYFVRALNPGMLLVALVLTIALYLASWGQNERTFGLDPFEWHERRFFLVTVEDALFGFLPDPSSGFQILIFILLLPCLFLIAGGPKSHESIVRMTPPVMLMFIAGTTTLAVITISYLSSFWIISRQWLGSMSLTALAIVWICAAATKNLQWGSERIATLLTFSLAVLMTLTFAERAYRQIIRLQEYNQASHELGERARDLLVSPAGEMGSKSDETHKANLNIALGGPVWPEFKVFYERYVGQPRSR